MHCKIQNVGVKKLLNMKNISLKKIKSALISHEKRQVYIYTLAQILTVFMTFAISLMLTNWLDPDLYGKYKYATNILLTFPVFVGFGIHFCVSRIVAEDKSDETHPVVSVSTLIMFGLGVVLTVVMLAAVFIQDSFLKGVFENGERLNSVVIVFPFFFVFSLSMLVTQLYQGTGRIYRLSIYLVTKHLIIILGLIGYYFLRSELSFEYCALLFIFSTGIVQIPVLFRSCKNGVRQFKESRARLISDMKAFGLDIYFGSIATTGASTLIGIVCGSVYGYEEYGYYSLALSLAQFFTFISSSLAVVTFRKNVNESYLKKSDLAFMYISNILIYTVFSICIGVVFFWFYPQEYARSVTYLRILGISYIITGITTFYNRFFIARKLGRVLLKCSLRVSVVNVLASIILIINYQIMGLVIASTVASLFNLIQYLYEYRRYCKIEV